MTAAVETLSARQTLDPETMWRATRALVDRLFGALDGDAVMDDALDILVELLGADRGLILLTESDGTTHVVNGRSQRKSLTAAEREEVSKTVIRRALDAGECVVWDPKNAARASSRPSSSVMALGIVVALAAPLTRGGGKSGVRGVLYVDVRDQRKFIGERHVEFFMSAAVLLGAVLEQHGRAQTEHRLLQEARAHCMDVRHTPPLSDLLAAPSLRSLASEIESALKSDAPMLILGESGTGKTLVAQAIAEASGRRPVVRAVLGGSDDLNTITSELFGHERGAFSGAVSKRVGLVEFADGGTLILDELLNLPPRAQQLLLDFTQFGTYRPLGYDRAEPKRARVRILAATNGDLQTAIRERRFREDLFYRLAAVTVEMPPLRERREDIPSLAESTLRRVDPGRAWSLSVPLRRLLVSPGFDWSGNVRQLERAIERARDRAVHRDADATLLTPEHLEARDLGQVPIASLASSEPAAGDAPSVTWQKLQAERTRIDEREQALLRKALADANGVVAQAARDLGIARTTLAHRLDALGIRAPKRSEEPK
jgi:transcriptional regulator with GAF, ATPase, and Fis domain